MTANLRKEAQMNRKKLAISIGGVAIGLSIGIASYLKIKDIIKWRQIKSSIPYPIADYLGQKPNE